MDAVIVCVETLAQVELLEFPDGANRARPATESVATRTATGTLLPNDEAAITLRRKGLRDVT